MKNKWHGGKGDGQRPTNRQRFAENYEAIFNKKANEERVELDEGVHTAESDGRQRESKLREHVEGAGIQGQADQEQAVITKRQPLSNDEIAELWGWKDSGNTEIIRNFARAIEKVHGIGENE